MTDIDFDELDRAVNSLMNNDTKKDKKVTQIEAEDSLVYVDKNETAFDRGTAIYEDSALVENGKVESESENNTASISVGVSNTVSRSNFNMVSSRENQNRTPAVRSERQPSLAMRRGGRFMDIVHSSLNTASKNTIRPVSRTGINVKPVSTNLQPTEDTKSKAEVAVGSMSMSSLEGKNIQSISQNQSQKTEEVLNIPDLSKEKNGVELPNVGSELNPEQLANVDLASNYKPYISLDEKEKVELPQEEIVASDSDSILDFNKDSVVDNTDTPVESVSTPVVDVVETTNDIEALLNSKLEEQSADYGLNATQESDGFIETPMQSPFIPDAKVEKRPLGSIDKNVDHIQDIELEKSNVVEDSIGLGFNNNIQNTQEDEVLSVQNNVNQEFNKSQRTPESVSSSDNKIYEGLVSTQKIQPQGPVSIPQQYKTEESKVDQNTNFDMSSYHQPLNYPAKKKSGWGVVVFILLAAVLGVVVALAWYLFLR